MKKRSLLIIASAGVFAVVLALAQNTSNPKTPPDSNVAALEQHITDLQAQIKTLEERLTKVESAVPRNVPLLPLQLVPNATPAPPSIIAPPFGVGPQSGTPPKIWGSGQINGWTYYVVPCAANER
jgi:hypothetical protein